MADGPLEHNQLLYGALQIPVPYTTQQRDKPPADALCVGTEGVEVKSTDRAQSLVSVYGTNGVVDLSAFFVQLPTVFRKLDLPNVLSSLSITYQSGGSDADYTENGSGAASGTAYGLGLSVSGTATAAASCIPVPIWTMDIPSEKTVATTDYIFFSPNLSDATILALLTSKIGTTVNQWPVFKTKPLVLTLFGSRSSASGRADYQASASNSASGTSVTQTYGYGTGFGYDQTIEQKQFPPTLHGSFSLTGSGGSTHTGTVAITVSAGPLSGGGANAATASALASVTPTSISATSPANIPTSGLYLNRIVSDEARVYGNYLLRATVVDMSQYA